MKNVIRVSQLKLKPDESEKKLKNMIIHTLKLPADAQIEWKIFKKIRMKDEDKVLCKDCYEKLSSWMYELEEAAEKIE